MDEIAHVLNTRGARVSSRGDGRGSKAEPQLLMSELNHRWSNDMQMILAMLSNAARSADSADAKEALSAAAQKVAVIADSRSHLRSATEADLELALHRTVTGLNALSADHIEVKLEIDGCIPPLNPDLVMIVALSVNEIAINAIKHAFKTGSQGSVLVYAKVEGELLTIFVEDDGESWPHARPRSNGQSGGLELVRRMIAMHGGLFLPPDGEGKRFEFRFRINPPAARDSR
jgi:two-component sensor histidine kinase